MPSPDATPKAPDSPLGRVSWIADMGVLESHEALYENARRLLDAGLPSLQLRARGWETDALVELGGELRWMAAECDACFVVNGNVAAALALAADGVHLPASDADVSAVRETVGPNVWIGVSAHDEQELARAAGADWAFLSPMYPTRSKPGAAGLGLERFAELCHAAPVPVLALGGVDATRYAECRAAGAAGVAAIRALHGVGGLALLEVAAAGR